MGNIRNAAIAMAGYLTATNGNLTDACLTGSMYFVNRAVGMSRAASVLASFAALSAGEIAQGMGILPGTYDPKDFAAAAIGAVLACGIDKVASKFREKEGELAEILD